jgi:glycosyltransferase involved in cell wall biosynthesis
MVNISLLIDNLGSGGAQRQLVLLANQLDIKGYNVTLITYGDSDHMSYMIASTNITRIKINTEGRNKLRKLVKVIIDLNKINTDVLISYLDNPNLFSAIYKLFNRDVIWIPSERNLNNGRGSAAIWRWLAYKSAHKVISNSYTQESWLIKNNIIPHSKSKVIWNGVYDDFFFNKVIRQNAEVKKLLCLGRISFQKYPELLLEAVDVLMNSLVQNFKVDWYGDDDPQSPNQRKHLISTVEGRGLPIQFHSASKVPHKLLSESDCLILTSRYEGTPNVVLEAMASGTFVIAPDIVDLPIILGDNERGIVFKKNDYNSLAQAILAFLNMSFSDKEAICERAKIYSKENFKGDMLSSKYIEVIEND